MSGGASLSHLEDGRVVLVAFAAPGELVEATVDRPHADYVEAHPADADGLVAISTDYPDVLPFLTFSAAVSLLVQRG